MTAEPDFLSTLPPEFTAEAQMHRERAVHRWQERSASEAQQLADQQAEEEDEDEEEDTDYDSEYEPDEYDSGVVRNSHRALGRPARGEKPKGSERSDGQMSIPSDDLTKVCHSLSP